MSLATPTTTDPVQSVVEILSGAATQFWQLSAPTVTQYQETPQKAKHNQNDVAIYCWSPTEASFEEFDAEDTYRVETQTVECQVWAWDKDEVETYVGDALGIIEQYHRDNHNLSEWHQISGDSVSDERAMKQARKTEHYIERFTVTLERLKRMITYSRTLTVADGETYTIPAGTTQRWEAAEVEGTLEVNGTLVLTDSSSVTIVGDGEVVTA